MTDPYFQQTHAISLKKVTGSRIYIADNIFRNLSFGGPTIRISELENSCNSTFAIVNNTFDLLFAFMNTNVIFISREYTDLTTDVPGLNGLNDNPFLYG